MGFEFIGVDPKTLRVPGQLAATFWELVRVPFQQADLVWGIVPLYFGWIVNELTASKATFSTSIQTGFALLWAGTQWVWQAVPSGTQRPEQAAFLPVNMGVTAVVLILGALALGSGLRRRYPRGLRFLGHSRFAGYFMIALFPVQSGYLNWTWQRVAAIAVFAIPVWVVVHLSVMPWRKK